MSSSNKLKQFIALRDVHVNEIDSINRKALQAESDISKHLAFETAFKSLNTSYDEFKLQHRNILSIASVIEGTDLAPFEQVRFALSEMCLNIETIHATLFGESQSSASNSAPISNSSHVKLGKIELPKFNGDIKKFKSFIDTYNSLIHNNNSLSDMDKFTYLISSLSGYALAVVQRTPFAEANYSSAYAALNATFYNKRRIAFSYLDSIMAVWKITPSSSTSENLRKLYDTFNENLAALTNLGISTKKWDFLLYYLLVKKLDVNTVEMYEQELNFNNETIPELDSLMKFVLRRCNALDTAVAFNTSSKKQSSNWQSPHNFNSRKSSSFSANCTADTVNKTQNFCSICNSSSHNIYSCLTLLNKSPKERYDFIKGKNWCTNCLGTRHSQNRCTSKFNCRTCNQKHHSLLHLTQFSSDTAHIPIEKKLVKDNVSNEPSSSRQVLTGHTSNVKNVLLATALVEILDSNNFPHKVRVLLDCGSEVNFITRSCAQRLGFTINRSTLSITGIGQMQMDSPSGIVSCVIRPVGESHPVFDVDAIVLTQICNEVPSSKIDTKTWSHIRNLKLADPNFSSPSKIDLLLGVDIFSKILLNNQISSFNKPTAISTAFGWILLGSTNSVKSQRTHTSLCCISDNLTLENTIKRFWETEEVPSVSQRSPDETICEQIFKDTIARSNSNRYIVNLPFRTDVTLNFGDTRSLAVKRFLSLENKLLKNPLLYTQYKDFMLDYLNSNHMEQVSLLHENCYYIPHHCVFKPDSSTTKLRVVFDASAKCPGYPSLNDVLHVGPKLQQNIVSLLLNFRLYTYVFTADIKQMYRQILISPSQTDYQRIIFRFSPNDSLLDFRLKTVTYGVSSSPFLALRTLAHLADEIKISYPHISQILSSHIYVDDVITGSDCLQDALSIQSDLITVFSKYGFLLRKWSSNEPMLLKDLPLEYLQPNSLSFDTENNFGIKVLGLFWQPHSDSFSYKVHPLQQACTKRTLLSDLARTYDPLGFLSPLTFFTKVLIQRLWCLGCSWDDLPPDDILHAWENYKRELSVLSKLHIPRHCLITSYHVCELHGFCDASEKGYGSVVYFRIISNEEKDPKIFLVIAKSKVAPLKVLSLPRLELCAAVLLSKLIKYVLATFCNRVSFNHIFAWSDSLITLSWIKSPPYKWKTFVSNRVSYIQEQINPSSWRYVPSAQNPADCASRGLLPQNLLSHSLWWSGPQFLLLNSSLWPDCPTLQIVTEEEKKLTLISSITLDSLDTLLQKYSSLLKIKRIIAYTLRFIHNSKFPQEKFVHNFSTTELFMALIILIKRVQLLTFPNEIERLENNLPLPKTFRKLSLFLDDQGVLRVGGRLQHSTLSFEQKHPILLPRNHRLTTLIIQDAHNSHLHPGIQTLHFLIRQNFWILSGKRAIRQFTQNCLRCWRLNPRPFRPPMGNLPSIRVSQLKPFSAVGLDFAGPMTITMSKSRGAKSLKAYICIFICCATKAIHIELVSDLSSEAFLAALRRFIARRGRCTYLFSDCGTNFVSANKYLCQLMENASQAEQIKWHFNPPSAPHFGGLFEAGIKSIKTHLYRVIGDQILTFEELYTVLVQIEAILNSRPLTALSSDPNDLTPLSPGSFLTLEPLTCIPDPDLSHLKLNHLTRYQLLLRLHQDFWQRWHKEYLHTLFQRNKWTDSATPIPIGTLVLIQNENSSPLKWPLGRIMDVHPGGDGITRVVTVKTLSGTFKRPVVKLCPLPSAH